MTDNHAKQLPALGGHGKPEKGLANSSGPVCFS